MKPRHLWSIFILIALLLAACSTGAAQTPDDLPPADEDGQDTDDEDMSDTDEDTGDTGEDEEMEEGRTIVIADISDDPVKIIDRYQPLIDYLAENLSDYGISGGEVKVAPDVETLTQWLKDGEVDIYFDSVYPALLTSQETGATPILRRWRDGASEYHAVIFVRADSGIESLEDLQGKIISYDEPSSTSGYLLPTILLLQSGLTPVEVDSPEASVAEDQVGYIFSEDDDNTIQWVVSELVAAGATDNLNYLGEIPEETRDQLAIIAESIDVPRQVVLAGPHLGDELINAIKAALIALEDAEGGLEILDTAKTTKFDEFPQGPEAALSEMRELLELIADE